MVELFSGLNTARSKATSLVLFLGEYFLVKVHRKGSSQIALHGAYVQEAVCANGPVKEYSASCM